MKARILVPFLSVINIGLVVMDAPLHAQTALPFQVMSRQVQNLQLETGATSASTNFLFNSEGQAILSMQFPTKNLSLTMIDPSGRRILWDENSVEPVCQRLEQPHPEDPNLIIYGYHMMLSDPIDGVWKVEVTFNPPLSRKWYTPVNLHTTSDTGVAIVLPAPRAIAGLPLTASLAVVHQGQPIHDFTYMATLHRVRLDGVGSGKTPLVFEKTFLDASGIPDWVAIINPEQPGLYYLDVVVKGTNTKGPYERHAGEMLEIFEQKARFTGNVKSGVK